MAVHVPKENKPKILSVSLQNSGITNSTYCLLIDVLFVNKVT